MISYNLKLIIFSIVLGALTLFYNGQKTLRSLAESSHELTANDKHENNELGEYANTNERKYKKEKYPKDDAKKKKKIPPITNKRFPGTPNRMTARKEIYNNAQGGNSRMPPGHLGYLEMQRKLYNDFNGKQELYFRKLDDESDGENNSGTKNPLKDDESFFQFTNE
ncbi:stevor PIR protein, putative [Plasmodium sp. gorilla clade G2]|uniref:stevor PIR protein, putative n=1 Tax=Plasmodium sp. gorilla clade G2 TaxID=880535 RepID=UPI000D28B699|nr:stevor PIR protein, putative [Plasmodium sp. gorilla clade G2]SOV20050.1 stevor PIR protein, putative [Plasmodium sp. gorilla clade G2]